MPDPDPNPSWPALNERETWVDGAFQSKTPFAREKGCKRCGVSLVGNPIPHKPYEKRLRSRIVIPFASYSYLVDRASSQPLQLLRFAQGC